MMSTEKKEYQTPTSIDEARKNFRYRGKIVVEVAGKIFTARSGEKAQEVIAKAKKQYPEATPKVTYLPKKSQIVTPTLKNIK